MSVISRLAMSKDEHVFPFQPQSAFWVSGCSGSGKTNWTYQFLKEKKTIV